jgi:hypothetical protein
MKLIKLTQGKFAKVDDEDFERISAFKWRVYSRKGHDTNYVVRSQYDYETGKTSQISMHREVMKIQGRIDHRNHDGLDNQKANLRPCTHAQNMMNRQRQKNHSNKYLGVYKTKKGYGARIWSKGKTVLLGVFETEIKAAKIRDLKAIELRGEFAYLNFQTPYPPVGEK